MVIREAVDRDVPEIYKIEALSFKDPYPIPLLYTYLYYKNSCFLVAELNGRIVGYVIALCRRRIIGHVISIAVHPDYRRKSIATVLMRAVETIFKKRKVRVVRLEVRVSNKPAINMYSKLGYEIGYRKKGYYRDGEDAYVMFKVLTRTLPRKTSCKK